MREHAVQQRRGQLLRAERRRARVKLGLGLAHQRACARRAPRLAPAATARPAGAAPAHQAPRPASLHKTRAGAR